MNGQLSFGPYTVSDLVPKPGVKVTHAFAIEPRARWSDPSTSHTAAECVKPGSRPLVEAIRWWISKQSEPKTAFQIADAIAGYRWQPDTVRTCVSRAGLHAVDNEGRTPGNRRCLRYVLGSA